MSITYLALFYRKETFVNLKEKIMEMPMWKAAVIAFFSLFITVAVIEEMIVSKLFGFMNQTADRMAVLFEQDKKDMEEDDKDEGIKFSDDFIKNETTADKK